MKVAMSVGIRRDGTIDVDMEDDDEWNFCNLNMPEAEFLHEELGRAIARQKERGFPRNETPLLKTEPVTSPEPIDTELKD